MSVCVRVRACGRVCAVTLNFSRPRPPCLMGALPPGHGLTLALQVTSALWPMEAAVYHLQSACGDTSTTVSQLLLGLPRPVPVANVSAVLGGVVKRVYEVISIQVQGAAPPGSLLGGRGCPSGNMTRRVGVADPL